MRGSVTSWKFTWLKNRKESQCCTYTIICENRLTSMLNLKHEFTWGVFSNQHSPTCLYLTSLSLSLSLSLSHSHSHSLSLSLLPRSPSHTTTPACTQSNRWWSAINEYRMVRGESNGVPPPTEVLHRPQVLAFVLKLTFEVLRELVFTEVLSHTVCSCLSSFSVNQWP